MYKVTFDFRYAFIFKNFETAAKFAQMLLDHQDPENSEEISVRIELIYEKENE